MDFVLRLPADYAITTAEKIAREERFQLGFKSLIYKYGDNEVPYDKSSVFNIDYDESGKYMRLRTLSPQYPKRMHDDIVDLLSKTFVGNAS
jgi:hypothetical protein